MKVLQDWSDALAGLAYRSSHMQKLSEMDNWAATPENVPSDIRAVWSESSPGAFWIAKDTMFLHANNRDPDQAAQLRRLICVFVVRTCQMVRFLTFRLLYFHVQLCQNCFIHLPKRRSADSRTSGCYMWMTGTDQKTWMRMLESSQGEHILRYIFLICVSNKSLP